MNCKHFLESKIKRLENTIFYLSVGVIAEAIILAGLIVGVIIKVI